MGDPSIQAFANMCPLLVDLDVGGCFHVSDLSLDALAKGCAHLERISLRGLNSVSDEG